VIIQAYNNDRNIEMPIAIKNEVMPIFPKIGVISNENEAQKRSEVYINVKTINLLLLLSVSKTDFLNNLIN